MGDSTWGIAFSIFSGEEARVRAELVSWIDKRPCNHVLRPQSIYNASVPQTCLRHILAWEGLNRGLFKTQERAPPPVKSLPCAPKGTPHERFSGMVCPQVVPGQDHQRVLLHQLHPAIYFWPDSNCSALALWGGTSSAWGREGAAGPPRGLTQRRPGGQGPGRRRKREKGFQELGDWLLGLWHSLGTDGPAGKYRKICKNKLKTM